MLDSILQSNWFQLLTKGKRYHVFFWLTYLGPWNFIYSPNPFNFNSLAISFIYFIGDAGASYFNIYYLIPRFIKPRNYFGYLFSLFATILFFSALLGVLLAGFATLMQINMGDFFFSWPYILGPTLGSISSAIFVVMALKLLKEHIQNENHTRQLEKEKTETELKFLRSQLNPHFLFNALNNIYFMIKKDPDQAAEALAKFSDVLRYQLYGNNMETINMQQEVAFINNYIEIAELRKGNSITVTSNIYEHWNGEQIAPLILIPFVENAFKHVSTEQENINHISLKIEKDGSKLDFNIENTISENNEEHSPSLEIGGIGLVNVRRRLELLYPGKHQLEIQENKNLFQVKLKINLH